MTDIPPGLEGPAKEVISGCHPSVQNEGWMAYDTTKLFTNIFIWDAKMGKMLLGYKKRGFGMGMYNGFGGKVETGETPAEGALRELMEEAGIEAELKPCGILLFYSEGYPYAHHIYLFSSNTFRGEPKESEEMRPEWFSLPLEFCSDSLSSGLPDIPFHKMWPDDQFWMPLMLSNQFFIGRADFKRLKATPAEPEMIKWWFGVVE